MAGTNPSLSEVHRPRSGRAESRADRHRIPHAGVTLTVTAALTAIAVAPAAMPASYSWTEYGVSESAAQGVDGAWVARSGFILFGLAVIWLTGLRHRAWGRAATVLHTLFGVSMFCVAAFSARSWDTTVPYVASEDRLHSIFATAMGFSFVGAVLASMTARRLSSWRAAVPDLVVVAVATAVPLAMDSAGWGVIQRTMFAVAGAWYVRESAISPDEGAVLGDAALR